MLNYIPAWTASDCLKKLGKRRFLYSFTSTSVSSLQTAFIPQVLKSSSQVRIKTRAPTSLTLSSLLCKRVFPSRPCTSRLFSIAIYLVPIEDRVTMLFVQLALLFYATKLISAAPSEWKLGPELPEGPDWANLSDEHKEWLRNFQVPDPINLIQNLRNEMRTLRDDLCPDCLKLCMYPQAEIYPRGVVGISLRMGLTVCIRKENPMALDFSLP